MIAAFAKAPITTPAMRSARASARPPAARATSSAAPMAAAAPAKAASGSAPAAEMPAATAITAPTAAPPLTPSRYGSASALRSEPCSAAPAMPSPAPTSSAIATRGTRSPRTIATVSASPPPLSARATSPSEIGTLPCAIAASARSASSAKASAHQSARVTASLSPGAAGSRDSTAASPSRTEGRPTSIVSTTITCPSRTARTSCHAASSRMCLAPSGPASTIAGSRFTMSSSETCGDGEAMSRVHVVAAGDREQLAEVAPCADGVDRRIPDVPEHRGMRQRARGLAHAVQRGVHGVHDARPRWRCRPRRGRAGAPRGGRTRCGPS